MFYSCAFQLLLARFTFGVVEITHNLIFNGVRQLQFSHNYSRTLTKLIFKPNFSISPERSNQTYILYTPANSNVRFDHGQN